jgi:hypothetical protein
MFMTPECSDLYEDWYCDQKEKNREPEHEILATYYQRKPVHAIRLAMCMHVADHRDLAICTTCFNQAVRILDWTETFLPDLLACMFKTASGEDHDRVLRIIRHHKGVISHSDLVRKWQIRGNSQTLRIILASLKESGRIEEINDRIQHIYVLKKEG